MLNRLQSDVARTSSLKRRGAFPSLRSRAIHIPSKTSSYSSTNDESQAQDFTNTTDEVHLVNYPAPRNISRRLLALGLGGGCGMGTTNSVLGDRQIEVGESYDSLILFKISITKFIPSLWLSHLHTHHNFRFIDRSIIPKLLDSKIMHLQAFLKEMTASNKLNTTATSPIAVIPSHFDITNPLKQHLIPESSLKLIISTSTSAHRHRPTFPGGPCTISCLSYTLTLPHTRLSQHNIIRQVMQHEPDWFPTRTSGSGLTSMINVPHIINGAMFRSTSPEESFVSPYRMMVPASIRRSVDSSPNLSSHSPSHSTTSYAPSQLNVLQRSLVVDESMIYGGETAQVWERNFFHAPANVTFQTFRVLVNRHMRTRQHCPALQNWLIRHCDVTMVSEIIGKSPKELLAITTWIAEYVVSMPKRGKAWTGNCL
ncbi:uncharacterized protein BDR25DRAFT_360490 [Lindgomyces ingoldianus]|uniref:Uncharacterized protein n=1 Tax=Lindgomyces ingoldianus TaxID=673940 RepID=A0ACB6QF52_9PLEO|nr:uncharacterized protein BDR25DRAFT_360490 [Lindgomyces ingoldianus]KAF2465549.1 hypothetical protein BDR25DRAFT_360490 [Lindgomyces ingoldianus]